MHLSESRNFQNFFRRRQTAGTRAAVATGLFGNEFRCMIGTRPSSSQASDTQTIDMQTVLLVEDDLKLAKIMQAFLQENDFRVEIEGHGDRAVDRILGIQPDAVVLDINLPGSNGFTICRQVRPFYPGAILILTARNEELDEVLGLEVGADDFLSKPVRPMALVARLKLHLHRYGNNAQGTREVLEVGDLVIHLESRLLELHGKPIKLTNAEFDILVVLARNKNKLTSREELFNRVHTSESYDFGDRSVDMHVLRLRRKIETDPKNPVRLQSVYGDGYMLSEYL
jgi:DNA-binding response OmpR family regulator